MKNDLTPYVKREKWKEGMPASWWKYLFICLGGKDQHPKIPPILSSLRVMSCNFLFTKNRVSFPLSPHFSNPLTHHPLELIFDPFTSHWHAVALLCWHVGGASPLARVGLWYLWWSFHHIPVILFSFIWCCDVYLLTSSLSCIVPLLFVAWLRCVPPAPSIYILTFIPPNCLARLSPCCPEWIDFVSSKPIANVCHSKTLVRTQSWFEQSNYRGLFRILVIIKFTKTMLLIYRLNPTFVVTVLTTIFVSDFPLLTKVLTDFFHLLPSTPFERSLAPHRKQTFLFFFVSPWRLLEKQHTPSLRSHNPHSLPLIEE